MANEIRDIPTTKTTLDGTELFEGQEAAGGALSSFKITKNNLTPDASETVKGIIELATTAEVTTGTDTVRAVTPAGLQAKVVGVQDFSIPAAAMWPRSSNGTSPLAPFEMATSLLNVVGLRFSAAVQQFAQCHFTLPRKWNNGTVTFQIKWKPEDPSSGDVRFGVQAAAYRNDSALTTAFGTEVAVTDTYIAEDDLHVTAVSSALTIAGTPQAGDLIAFQINRDPANGGDTLTEAAILIELTVFLTTTAAIDA